MPEIQKTLNIYLFNEGMKKEKKTISFSVTKMLKIVNFKIVQKREVNIHHFCFKSVIKWQYLKKIFSV